MRLLDPPEPAWIAWDPDGVSFDVKEHERVMDANDLRARVRAAVMPAIPAKQIARLADVDIRTIYRFIEGTSTPDKDVLKRIERAMQGARR